MASPPLQADFEVIVPPDRRGEEADLPTEEIVADRRSEANRTLGMGLGIGVIGVASAALFGAVCPVCVVAAPALVVTGAIRHARAKRPPGKP